MLYTIIDSYTSYVCIFVQTYVNVIRDTVNETKYAALIWLKCHPRTQLHIPHNIIFYADTQILRPTNTAGRRWFVTSNEKYFRRKKYLRDHLDQKLSKEQQSAAFCKQNALILRYLLKATGGKINGTKNVIHTKRDHEQWVKYFTPRLWNLARTPYSDFL